MAILIAAMCLTALSGPAWSSNVVAKPASKWPTRTIDFVVCDADALQRLGSAVCRRQAPRKGSPARSARLSDEQAQLVRATIKRWNHDYGEHLRLREVGTTRATSTLVFRRSSRDTRCSTQKIGYVPGQTLKYVSIGARCGRGSHARTRMGVVAHEILHSVGIYHEQQRQDGQRMARVRNVGGKARQWRSVCDPQVQRCRGDEVQGKAVGPYDFGSVMHYSVPRSKARLTAAGKNRLRQQKLKVRQVGQRDWLSRADERGLRALYPAPRRSS